MYGEFQQSHKAKLGPQVPLRDQNRLRSRPNRQTR